MSFFDIFNKDESDKKDLIDKTLVVKKIRCPQNHACPSVKVCPVGALSQNKFEAPKVDMKKCIKCGKCAKFCPMKALALE